MSLHQILSLRSHLGHCLKNALHENNCQNKIECNFNQRCKYVKGNERTGNFFMIFSIIFSLYTFTDRSCNPQATLFNLH
jgi:hypothetical protein